MIYSDFSKIQLEKLQSQPFLPEYLTNETNESLFEHEDAELQL